MNIEQFCKLPDEISTEQAKKLNKELASKSLTDIPKECRSEVESYLCTQLIMSAVESDLIESLDSLVKEIQETA